MNRRTETWAVVGIVLLAFVLRAGWHWYAPHGWREDELSNALVVSQHVLEGDVRLYYNDASGHEGLYHWLQAGTMALFGPGVAGIRGVSIGCGTLAVFLLYLLARQMFNQRVAVIAALTLAVNFWGLMYSRSGQRHISVTVTTLAAFYFLWRGLSPLFERDDNSPGSGLRFSNFLLSGLCMGVGFYTYFASRGVPLILAAFVLYLALRQPGILRRAWRGLAVTALVAGAFALPLFLTLRANPGAEARVSELAAPIEDARAGDLTLVGQYALRTLSMFTHDGDDEVLYNVPGRPVFSLLGGLLFWAGVLWASVQTFAHKDARHALLLLWLLAGLAPGVLSVPAASLGHTILAQPVAMMLPAVALDALAGRWRRVALIATALYLGWEAARGVRDYFVLWPTDPFNRVLHHSDLHEAARLLNVEPVDIRDVAIGSYLNEQWDQQVMQLDLTPSRSWHIRAFDPHDAMLYPADGSPARWILPEYLCESWAAEDFLREPLESLSYGYYSLSEPIPTWANVDTPIAHFDNGLGLLAVSPLEVSEGLGFLVTAWRVEEPLILPERPLFSKPPAPDQDDTPRLAIFVQLLDAEGQRVAGWDGLRVDPYTLYEGDRFLQRHEIAWQSVPPGGYMLVVGLYNPMTGARHLDRLTGRDHFVATTLELEAP